jgi:hypothetical protein
MADTQGMLREHSDWFYRQCRYEAAKLRGVEAEELMSEAWIRFVKRAEEGFFDQRPHKSLEAQAKYLMRKAIGWVVKDHHRDRERWRDLARANDDEGGDPFDRRADDRPIDPDQALQHQQELRQLLAMVHEATSPVRALCLLSRDLPRAVMGDDVSRAKAYRRGGSNMPMRPAPEAYGLLDHERQDAGLTCDIERWKPVLGSIYYAEGPLDTVPDGDRDTLAGNVERQANRAIKDLQKAVSTRGVEV